MEVWTLQNNIHVHSLYSSSTPAVGAGIRFKWQVRFMPLDASLRLSAAAAGLSKNSSCLLALNRLLPRLECKCCKQPELMLKLSLAAMLLSAVSSCTLALASTSGSSRHEPACEDVQQLPKLSPRFIVPWPALMLLSFDATDPAIWESSWCLGAYFAVLYLVTTRLPMTGSFSDSRQLLSKRRSSLQSRWWRKLCASIASSLPNLPSVARLSVYLSQRFTEDLGFFDGVILHHHTWSATPVQKGGWMSFMVIFLIIWERLTWSIAL